MLYIGVDYHQKQSHIIVTNKEEEVIKSLRLRNGPEDFTEIDRRAGSPL